MKIKSASGITCYIKDLNKTVAFYEALGFDFKKKEAEHATGYINWFWIDFIVSEKGSEADNEKTQLYLYLTVEDVDATYKEVINNGFKPLTEPENAHGNREFVLQDPDGYKLVLFKRK